MNIAIALIEALHYFRGVREAQKCIETKEYYSKKITMLENKLITAFMGKDVTYIEDADLDKRIVNALYGMGIYSFFELTQYTRKEVLDFPNIGEEYLEDIEKAMAKEGLRFVD